jgi:FMN-dependent NADH-azoreductase
MKPLHLDSSITGEDSVTRRLSARVVENPRQAYPGISIHYRDLALQPLPDHRLVRVERTRWPREGHSHDFRALGGG